MLKTGFIYVHINTLNGKKYVGKTTRTIEERAEKDGVGYIRKNEHSKFARAIKKYGWNYFITEQIEIVHVDILDERERFWIEHYDSFKNGYNSTLGGEGVLSREVSDITKKKISKANKGKKPWTTGKSLPQKTKDRIGDANRGENNGMYGRKYSHIEKKRRSNITTKLKKEFTTDHLLISIFYKKNNQNRNIKYCYNYCERCSAIKSTPYSQYIKKTKRHCKFCQKLWV